MKIEKVYETPDNENFFFGYYDVPQLSKDNNILLCQKVENIYELPTAKNKYDIFLFNIKENQKKKIAETRTINFQQGCRAQWVGPDHQSKIIFNDVDNNHYISKIIDIETGATEKIPTPVYTISKDGNFIVSADFERLFWCRRGYSYDAIQNVEKNKNIANETIKIYDLNLKKLSNLFSINDVINLDKKSIMMDAVHYMEHFMFSPCCKKFVFLHRFKIRDGGIFSRLISYNLLTKKLDIILDSGRMSHFNFLDSENMIFYGSVGNKITNLRKYKNLQKIFKFLLKFYKIIIKDNTLISKKITNDGYYYYNFEKKSFTKKENSKLNSEDGHPTTHEALKMNFITDNYADDDNSHYSNLIFFSNKNNSYEVIDKIKSISELDNTPLRCDLHPRISYDGNYLSIDAFKNKNRKSIVYKIYK